MCHARGVVAGVEDDEDVRVASRHCPPAIRSSTTRRTWAAVTSVTSSAGPSWTASSSWHHECGPIRERRRTSTASRGSSGAGSGCGHRCEGTACPRCTARPAAAAASCSRPRPGRACRRPPWVGAARPESAGAARRRRRPRLRASLEEHLGAAVVEFEIAALVDLQKVDASVAGDGLAELLVVGSLGQLVHQGRSGGVADPLSTHSRGHVRDTVRVDS